MELIYIILYNIKVIYLKNKFYHKMTYSFYGAIVPSEDFIKKAIKYKLEKEKLTSKKEVNLYVRFLEYLRDEEENEDLQDEDEWEEAMDDPLTYLINNVDYIYFTLPDVKRSFIEDGNYVFIGEKFEPFETNRLLSPGKQVPPYIKKGIKEILNRYEFNEKPEVFLSADKNIPISTLVDPPKIKRLS